MAGKNNHNHETENKNTGFIVGFFIVAIVSIAVCVFCRHLIDDGSSEKEVKNKQDRPVTTVAEVTEVPETTTVVTTTAKPQNLKYVYDDSGKELPALNIILDKTSNKTYKINLDELANENDIITAFRFIFYAEDGVSNLGELKGGYGVNVDPLCPLATDDAWYQSEDFSVYSDGAYCEVVCEVPLELAMSIDVKGKLMVGYWWSDQQTVRLERIICEKYTHVERPIDDSKSFEVNIPLNFNNAETQKYLLPLREIVPEGAIPEFVSFTIESTNGEPIGKFSGQIGLSTKASLYDGFYKEKDMVVYSDTNTRDVTWLVPDEIKKLLDYDGNIELSFWWGDCEEIKITKVYIQYSEK